MRHKILSSSQTSGVGGRVVEQQIICNVTYLVAWPLNESEAGGDLALIETSLLFSC